ncbi:DUF3742 family protein (plasmid) [Streptomyces sp. BI20]|uniref:DUF3742 family protein n=1 Tax=Streptomyces sp. BI20 TaxID=3403460 RepID=UPI003C7080C2
MSDTGPGPAAGSGPDSGPGLTARERDLLAVIEEELSRADPGLHRALRRMRRKRRRAAALVSFGAPASVLLLVTAVVRGTLGYVLAFGVVWATTVVCATLLVFRWCRESAARERERDRDRDRGRRPPES